MQGDVFDIARKFRMKGEVVAINEIKRGYINETYRVETHDDAGVHYYLLQKINTNVFPRVDELIANYNLVTTHLHETFLLEGHQPKGSV